MKDTTTIQELEAELKTLALAYDEAMYNITCGKRPNLRICVDVLDMPNVKRLIGE